VTSNSREENEVFRKIFGCKRKIKDTVGRQVLLGYSSRGYDVAGMYGTVNVEFYGEDAWKATCWKTMKTMRMRYLFIP
jgi:hypothetical protein